MAGKYGYMRKYNLSLKKRIKAINVRTLDGRVVASPNSSEIGRDVSGETFFTGKWSGGSWSGGSNLQNSF